MGTYLLVCPIEKCISGVVSRELRRIVWDWESNTVVQFDENYETPLNCFSLQTINGG